MLVAKKILERAEQLKVVDDLEISPMQQMEPKDKQELERILHTRSHQRYLIRLMKNVNKRYGKVWTNHKFDNQARDRFQELKAIEDERMSTITPERYKS